MSNAIRFDDGAAYERYMGVWSRSVGEKFLQWLDPKPGLRWLDIGCGNGVFTELLAERCAPSAIHGIDPSEAQLAFARARPKLKAAVFKQGDAMALPFAENSFEAAVMPLVIFFVPQPAQGVEEMARVVAPGGWVTAYGWDLLNGGFPYATLQAELRSLGFDVPLPPNPDASQFAILRQLWTGAGLEAVEMQEITVNRIFDSFDDYWQTVMGAPSAGRLLAELTAEKVGLLKAKLREVLRPNAEGKLTLEGRANAVKGRVPQK